MIDLSSMTSDKKIYIRNKYYDGLPLTSNDLHNEKDLMIKKMSILLDNMIGSSPLEDPQLGFRRNENSIDIRFTKSLPINLNGEIFLVNNSENLYPWENISDNCSLVLVAWYESINANSIIYEYGGIGNNPMENDLVEPTLKIQTSSRYQIRWHVTTTDKIFNSKNLDTSEFTLSEVSSVLGTINNYTCKSENNSVDGKFIVNDISSGILARDSSIIAPYSDGKIYILPIARVSKEDNTLDVNVYHSPPIGGNQIISQATEPEGYYKEGTIWYNNNTGEFKFYVNDIGFVDIYSKLGFVQLQATTFIKEASITPQDITLTIPIDTYLETDLLRVVYEGAELAPGINYTVDATAKTITLLNFTTEVGDAILFVVTRLVGTSDMKTTLTLLEDHIKEIGNNTASGHLKLSDYPDSSLNQTKGIAATPAALKNVENKINSIVDDTTGKSYRLGINNGLIYIKEEDS